MSSRLAWSPLPALVVVLGLLWVAPGCLAAGPIKGGRYAGPSIAFNVGDNGRAFVSNPHIVFQDSELDAPCARTSLDLGGWRRADDFGEFTDSNGTPVHIRPNDTFFLSATADRPTHTRLRLRGRFIEGGLWAIGSFRVRSRAGRAPCVRRRTFRARFTGQRHRAFGTCSPPQTKTLVDDRIGRVYRETYVYDPHLRDVFEGGSGDGGAVYGCDRRTRRSWFLAADGAAAFGPIVDYLGWGESVKRTAIAGDEVALGLEHDTTAFVGNEVRIVDLQTGAVQIDRDSDRGPHYSTGRVWALVVTPDGSAAWIECLGPHDCQVVDEVAFGPDTPLDHSNTIDRNSLTLHGTKLSWRDNGETRTATLG